MSRLRRIMFGNPILRQPARHVTVEEIRSPQIQQLVQGMDVLLQDRKHGVGLAAPQVGRSIALTLISIKPTPKHPGTEPVHMVVFNPVITKTYGRLTPKWEGCISFGSGPSAPYAQAMRYDRVRVQYIDELGATQHHIYEGLVGHVLQHEIDHLNGILFVDRVIDTKSYTTMSEYRKRTAKPRGDSAHAKTQSGAL